MRSTLRSGAAWLGLMLSCASSAHAQSIEYGALEQLFGEPVTMSATGEPQRASDVPANLTIITADEIARSGANTIPDVLRFVAGIDVRSYGVADSAVGIRGDNTALNPRVLVLLDGRQVLHDDYGFTAWQLIPVALGDIRQIEIIKGPNSALYGFDAVSGVINIITYDALDDHVNAARVEGGSLKALDGEAVASVKPTNAVGIRLSATGSRSDEYGASGQTPFNQPRSGNVAVDLHARLAPRVDLLLEASVGSLVSAYFADIGYYVRGADQANSLRGRLSGDTGIGLLDLDVYRNENRTAALSPAVDESRTASGPGYEDGWRQDVTVLRIGDMLKLAGSQVVRVELEYRDNVVSSARSFDGHTGYDTFAGSASWSRQLTARLSATAAVRVDRLDLSHGGAQLIIPGENGGLFRDVTITAPSFNSGLVFKPTSRDTLRLLAARAVQLPSLIDFSYVRVGSGFITAGDPGVQPSDVLNFEIDWDRSLPRLESVLRSAAFIAYTDRTVGSPFGSGAAFLPDGLPLLTARNFNGSRELGGELTLKGQDPSGLRWTVGYALALVHDETSAQVLSDASSVAFEDQTPTHAVTLSLGDSWKRFDADLQARWQSRFLDYRLPPGALGLQAVSVPNYLTLDLRLAYRLTHALTVAVVGDQLNQSDLIESSGVRTERRGFASASLRF